MSAAFISAVWYQIQLRMELRVRVLHKAEAIQDDTARPVIDIQPKPSTPSSRGSGSGARLGRSVDTWA